MRRLPNLAFCLIILCVICVLPKRALAQTNSDFLWNVWEDKAQADTTRFEAIYEYVLENHLSSQLDSAIYFLNLAYEFASEKGLKKQQAEALHGKGFFLKKQGDTSNALDHYHRSLVIKKEINDRKGTIKTLYNVAEIYRDKGDYQKVLEYYQRNLKIAEELVDKKEVAKALKEIGWVYKGQGKNLKAIDSFQKSQKISEEIGDKKEVANALINIAWVYKGQGNNLKAIDNFQRSLKISEEIGDKIYIAENFMGIANIYSSQGDYLMALDYHQRSLNISEELGRKKSIAISLNNIGRIYKGQGNYVKAMEYYKRSLKIKEDIDYKVGIAYSLSNIASIFEDQGNYTKALDYHEKSLRIREEIGHKNEITFSMINIGLLLNKLGDSKRALTLCNKAFQLAQEIGYVRAQKRACQCLYSAYKAIGNNKLALTYHEQILVLIDSLQADEIQKKLQQMEFAKQVYADSVETFERERQIELAYQEEIHEEEKQRNLALGGGLLVLLLAGGIYSRLRYVRKSKAIIEKEKDRSESLLLNILPAEIAAELKEKGESEAKDFDNVTVLFTDFVEFTQTAEKLSAKELVSEINACFKAFDQIMEKYQLEKIKTIGDAYMAAGGLHIPRTSDPKDVIQAALEMQTFMLERKATRSAQNLPAFDMRVGIHTGPVVAGIVGVKKFQYDIWGDTVNTASRMESSGEVGKVNISNDTYELIKEDDQFSFESRGKMAVKGKGEMEMFFVGLKHPNKHQ